MNTERAMSLNLARMVERYCRIHRGGGAAAMVLDYDGTLVPLTNNPAEASAPGSLRKLLNKLAAQSRVRVAISAGRGLEELKSLVGVDGIDYIGCMGLECEIAGVRTEPPNAKRSVARIEEVRLALKSLPTEHPGCWLEEKPFAITLHVRGLDPSELTTVVRTAMARIGPLEDGLRILRGRSAIEILPDVGWTKGTAVCAQVWQESENCVPFCAGDAPTDADAFEAVLGFGGWAVGVGRAAPRISTHRVETPQKFVELLRYWCDCLTRSPETKKAVAKKPAGTRTVRRR